MMRLNNKGMSIVEVVITFTIIMMITTGLLMIVVNYRSKVSVSNERLTMDTFKNNITQDIYKDILKHGLVEINEYNEVNLENVMEMYRREVKDSTEYNVLATNQPNVFDTNYDSAFEMIKNDLATGNVKVYSGSDYKNKFANLIINKYKEKFGSCLTLTDLNRCVNIIYQDGTPSKAFGTSVVNTLSRESIENKFLYYDGIKYKIADKLPDRIPKDSNGNDRPLVDLQRIKLQDDGMLSVSSTVLEDGNKINIYSIDVLVYHVDFREDFGVHVVVSTDDVSI